MGRDMMYSFGVNKESLDDDINSDIDWCYGDDVGVGRHNDYVISGIFSYDELAKETSELIGKLGMPAMPAIDPNEYSREWDDWFSILSAVTASSRILEQWSQDDKYVVISYN